MAKPSNEAFFWMLFSAGGVVAALLIPVQLFLFGVAFPLGWLQAPSYENLTVTGAHAGGEDLPIRSVLAAAVSLGTPFSLYAV